MAGPWISMWRRSPGAIYKAARAIGGHDYQTSRQLADEVVQRLSSLSLDAPPTVEQVQDMVEKVLIENGQPNR